MVKELITFKEYEEYMNYGDGLSIKEYFSKKEKKEEENITSIEEFLSKTDEEVFYLLWLKYNKIFIEDNIKEKDLKDISSHPIYTVLYKDLISLLELKLVKSFKYLLDNIKLNSFDIDMTLLGKSVKDNNELILEELLIYMENGGEYDGSNGLFSERIKSFIIENINVISVTQRERLYKLVPNLK